MNTLVNSWFGTEECELTPGVLNANAERAFTSGQCHALALALHELTGWEVGGLAWTYVGDEDIPLDLGETLGVEEMPKHVVVKAPDGSLLDVEGWGVEDRWGRDDFRPLAPEVILDTFPRAGYLEPDMDAANAFAPLVLAEYTEVM
jgi:hypothetical protein